MSSKQVVIRKCYIIFSLIASIFTQEGFAQKDGDPAAIGTYRIVRSEALGGNREILVHLPDGYESTQERYPVIVKPHGTPLAYFAQIVGTLDLLMSRGLIPKMVFVGIKQHGHDEVIPEDACREGRACTGSKFLSFLSDELLPFIDASYRTRPYRVYMGSLDCAFFGAYALLTRPDLFQAYLLNSPAWYGESGTFLDYVRPRFEGQSFSNHFLFVTYLEHESERVRSEVRAFISLINSENPNGLRWGSKLITGDDYDIFSAYTYCRGAFLALFPDYACSQEIMARGWEAVQAHYHGLTERYGYFIDVPLRVLDSFGNMMWRQRRMGEAERAFLTMVERDPMSINGLFRLAGLNSDMGRYDRSKAYYRKILEIDQDIDVVRIRLAELERVIEKSASYAIEKEIEGSGLRAAARKFKRMRSDDEDDVYFDEGEFNALGYRLMGQEKFEEAILVFSWNVELNPRSANAYDSLGEAYMKAGMRKQAVENYRKSLELNPENDNAKEMLKRLEKEDG